MATNKYSFCAPCTFVQGTDTYQCTCSLAITDTTFNIHLVNAFDVSNVVCFELNKYDILQVAQSTCTLISKKHPSVSLVFSDNQSHYRFIYSLGEACAIAPLVRGYYKIMEINLFVPKGEYSFIAPQWDDYFYYLVSQNICTIKPSTVPEKTEFFDLITPHYHKRAIDKFHKYLRTHPKSDIASRPVTLHNLLNWLRKAAPPKIGRLKTLTQRFERQNYSVETGRLLISIEQDSIRTECDDPSWNEDMKNLATSILRADVMHGNVFNQGEFEIAQRAVLLMMETSGIKNDDSQPPSWYVDMSDNDVNDFALTVYQKVVSLFKHFDKDVNVSLSLISEGVFDMFKDVVPEIRIWFMVHKIDLLVHVVDDFSELYARRFRDIWKVWQWILSCQFPENALIAFIGAIIFFSVPVYIENGVTMQKELMDDKFHNLTEMMDIDVLLNFANYLMRKSKYKRARTDM
ncbi:hypothetical protein TRFO_11205 [Tritrichomonas foetus]|uniref:Rab-GAP TBC domain-containing protein n=1 Tax=Tritrichomonas foetus TaxID=1144522 RepID=A0A1J4J6R8_9EUKA|nr:hypothetical protein TRFO_11205 [Tritrichomonas foetus]|eukprot:OHS94345.1 hypothetical protein TRFO_11205 [Tritrichomonas foetus]